MLITQSSEEFEEELCARHRSLANAILGVYMVHEANHG
jgi:hypothetical protein